MFSPAYKAGQWDGYIHLVRHRQSGDVFPTGLLQHVLAYAEGFGRSFEVTDERVIPPDCQTYNSPKGLDPAQSEAVLDALTQGRGIIQMPTGTGKTVVLTEILRHLCLDALILCNSKILLEQLSKVILERLNIRVGKIGDGDWHEERVTVATVQTLYRKLKDRRTAKSTKAFLEKIGLVICDEAHHLGSESFSTVMQSLPNAYYRLGLSATPHRSRGSGKVDRGDPNTFYRVTAWTGPVISKLDTEEAVDSGRIVPVDIVIVKGTDWHGQANNYADAVHKGITSNVRRLEAVGKLTDKLGGKQTLILTDRTEQGINLMVATHAPFVYGKTSKKERESYFQDFRDSKISCLVISKIGDEGLDLPNVEVLIMAAAGRAPHRTIQRIGRGRRAVPGKTHLLVFDFEDTCQYLGEHYRRRKRTYESDPTFSVVEMMVAEILGGK